MKLKCIEYLNTGEKEFNVGDIVEVTHNGVVQVEDDFEMEVYKTSDGFGLCDFEIEGYFTVIED